MPDSLQDTYRIGDCLSVLPEIEPESVDLILTDPPFGINYQSNRRLKTERFDRITNDESLEAMQQWFPGFLDQVHRILKPDRHCYIFCNWRNYPFLWPALSASLFGQPKGVFVWDKLRHGTGDLHGGLAPAHEWILFLSKGRRLWKRGFVDNPATVPIQSGRPLDILHYARVPPGEMVHPTQKPVSLLRYLIEISTDPGELVCDPFAGSFSTARACKSRQTAFGDFHQRFYFCIELDPQYERLIADLSKQCSLSDL